MSQWLTDLLQTASDRELAGYRRDALQHLQAASWPTRKTEAWRYVPLTAWERCEPQLASSRELAQIEGLQSIDIAFYQQGVDLQGLPEQLPQGLNIRLADADDSDTFVDVKPGHHIFGLINDLMATDTLVIDVADGANIELPIHLHYCADQATHSRVLVRIGEGAKVTVIEHNFGDSASRNTSFAQYQLLADASLEHYRLALNSGKALTMGGGHFELNDRAQLHSTLVAVGSELSRVDVDIYHRGSYANARMDAIYLLDGREVFDLHSNVEHQVANGTTEENVRGIVAGNARAIFNGRIHIHKDAQKNTG